MRCPTTAAAFAPHEALADQLLDGLTQFGDAAAGDDGAHDAAHLLRVWRSARRIAEHEPGCDTALLAAAVLLHDCVAVEKNSPDRPIASRLAAARARIVIAPLHWSAARMDALAHAIEAHSFSAAIPPVTTEARILQDADRLDAIGAVGIARCFYTAGRMGSALYDAADPHASARPLDDRRFALDHFAAKLLRLCDGFQTQAGRTLAAARLAHMQAFLAAFDAEL